MIELSGCESSKFKAICASVDKLDKQPWEEIKEELETHKGLTPEQTEKLGRFVIRKGPPREMLEGIKADNLFEDNKKANDALDEMNLLFNYCEALGCLNNLSFDFSLA